MTSEPVNLIDRSVKALFRECPAAVLRLAGLTVESDSIRVEDPNLNLPELRADHVFLLPEEEGVPPCAVYLEYQLEPDPDLLPFWCAKWGGLNRQLKMPVILLSIYLQKGDRATFPDHYLIQAGALRTKLEFTAIRLWEHAERIRNGELPELAPLLVLCEETPTEQTVQEEVELIHHSGLPDETQVELLSIALMVASRHFTRESLRNIFREELNKMKDQGIVGDWLEEREARGLARGEALGIRETLLRVGSKRFGEPSAETVRALEAISSVETLLPLTERLLEVENWNELLTAV